MVNLRFFSTLLCLGVVSFSRAGGLNYECLMRNYTSWINSMVDVTVKQQKGTKEILRFLHEKNIPHFLRKVDGGREIPVILVDKDNYQDLAELFETSVGFGTKLIKDSRHDHGVLRIPGHGGQILDYYRPSKAGSQQMHRTGIRSYALDSYVQRASRQVVESSYYVTPDEIDQMIAYHNMRKAALVQFPYGFDVHGVPEPRPFNFVKHPTHDPACIGETCYSFGAGGAKTGTLGAQINHMKYKLWDLTKIDADDLLGRKEILEIQQRAKKRLIELNDYRKDPKYSKSPGKIGEVLYPTVLADEQMLTLVNKLVGQELAKTMSKDDKIRVLNLITAIDLTKQQKVLLADTLGIDYEFWGWSNPRLMNLFVFDNGTDEASRAAIRQSFWDATYENHSGQHDFGGAQQFNRKVTAADRE